MSIYDNPAGKEPLPIIEDLQKTEGFELRTFAVPPPGVEMGAQVLDITQRYRPDFVIAHLFGRSPSVAIKEFKRAGYPLSKVVGPRLGLGRGRHPGGRRLGRRRGLSHDAVRRRRRRLPGPPGNQGDVQEGRARSRRRRWTNTVIYNRGLLAGGGACRGDPQRAEGQRRQAADRRGRQEGLRADPRLHARRPGAAARRSPPTDHEGGGWVQIFQVKGGKFVKETDWFRAYREVVEDAVKTRRVTRRDARTRGRRCWRSTTSKSSMTA